MTGSRIKALANRAEAVAHRIEGTVRKRNVEELDEIVRELRDVPSLTQREATEVVMLLDMILTNDDQWTMFDLAALRRASNKLNRM